MPDDTLSLIRRLIGGDAEARAAVLAIASVGGTPEVLVAAALVGGDRGLLVRAGEQARTTRDRQLTAIVTAHLDQQEDRFDALVRDHLADHPDSLLAAWVASQHRSGRPTAAPTAVPTAAITAATTARPTQPEQE